MIMIIRLQAMIKNQSKKFVNGRIEFHGFQKKGIGPLIGGVSLQPISVKHQRIFQKNMVIQKAIQIQKNRSNANKRAEMKQWILKCILRKESVGIRKDLPEDILGYALSNNKINQTE